MRKYVLLLIFCGFLVQLSAVNAGAFEQGLKSFQQKDYAQAEKFWLPLAKAGDARAQFNLALVLQKKEQTVGQKEKVTEYLAMSKAEGLVDGYFVTFSSPPKLELAEMSGDAQRLKTKSKKELKTASTGVSEALVWLNQQQKKSYTLQLATGKSKQPMEKMHKKLLSRKIFEQPETLYVHKIEQQGQEKSSVRYVLTYGVFETYQQAKDQVSKLPESLQKSKPWIRKIATLQSIASTKQP